MTPSGRLFVLSPANLSGKRGRLAIAPGSENGITQQLRSPGGIPLGELFSFISSLYFRGKLTYARRFARPPASIRERIEPGILVITPSAGLRSVDTRVTLPAVQAFAREEIDIGNPGYRGPLEDSALALEREIGDCEVVLLGSIASAKYVDVLLAVFGDQLSFPVDFVGRGDMSRGGLLLRRAASGEELRYIPVAGAVRRGARPPRLNPAWPPR
jgi:hypothetical protein